MFTEWTLIFFTCLMQAAAGLTLFAAIAQNCGHTAAAKGLWRLALAACILGGLASLLHLQNPFNAPYALTQMGHSWLGREIGMVVLLGLLLCWLAFKGGGILLAWAGALAGILLVLVMAQVYASIQAAPLWRSTATTVGFLGAMLAMGAACTLAVTRTMESASLRQSALIVMTAGLLCSVGAPLLWAVAVPDGNHAQEGLFRQALFCMGMGHMLLAVLGCAVFFSQRARAVPAGFWIGTACIMGGELAGRVLFFAAHLRLGV